MFIYAFAEYRIREINIEGNIFFNDKKILSIMQNKTNKIFKKRYFDEDVLIIKNFYKSKGFLNIKIKRYEYKIKNNEAYIYIDIYEDFVTIINRIKFFGNTVFSEKELLDIMNFKKNMPFNELYLSMKQLEIIDKYAANGYIYAEINYDIIDRENKYRKMIYFNINENKRSYIKDIILDSIPEELRNIAYKELNLKRGDIYIPSKIYEYKYKLLQTGLFENVEFNVIGIETKEESLLIYFTGTPLKKHWISGGILYQFPDKGKLSLAWGNDNVFKNAESFSISSYFIMDYTLNNWFNLLLTYKVPYLFIPQFSFTSKAGVDIQKSDFISEYDFVFDLGFGKTWHDIILTNRYKYKISIIDTISDTLSYRFQNANTNSVSFNMLKDSRDNPFYPLNGYIGLILFEIAGGVLGGYNNFTKYIVDFSNYKTFLSRLTIASRIRGGVIIPFSSSIQNGVSIDEQFTLGGYSSIRGVKSDSLGPYNEIGTHSGILFSNINFEFRIVIYKLFGINYFFDMGIIENSFDAIEFNDYVFSGGFGVFIKTPIGPVRFDIARSIMNYNGTLEYYLNLGNAF